MAALKDTVPAANAPVDYRSALAQAQGLERTYAQAVHVLRAVVEATSGRAAAEAHAREVQQATAALERELPALQAKVKEAQAMSAQAAMLAKDATARELAAAQAAVAEAQMQAATLRQDGEARARELEAAYQARQAQLAQETGEAEARLARVQEELAAVVARHARP